MPRKISEDQTRKQMIDPQLEQASWYLRDHSKIKIEIPVDGYDAEPWNGVSDYCLYHEYGGVLSWKIKSKITQRNYNADQIRFLLSMQRVFLQSAISKPLTCTSRRWICLARMRWSGGLRRRK